MISYVRKVSETLSLHFHLICPGFISYFLICFWKNCNKHTHFCLTDNFFVVLQTCILHDLFKPFSYSGGGGVQGEFWGILGNFFLGNSRKPGGLSQNSPKFPKNPQNKISDSSDNYSYCFHSFHIHIPITYYILVLWGIIGVLATAASQQGQVIWLYDWLLYV